MGVNDNEGRSRLENPDDFVRIEVEVALRRQIPVIPVLVQAAKIPTVGQLPGTMQDLSYRNGLEVRSGTDFHRDMDRLIDHLKQQLDGFNATQSKPGRQSVQNETKQPAPDPPMDMVKVPKGSFLYGENKTRAVIDHDYWIDRYPVTNEKYRAFILAGGYENQQYWSGDGWKWRMKDNILAPKFWNSTKLDREDHPVVSVSC